jgi:hypothetical protein
MIIDISHNYRSFFNRQNYLNEDLIFQEKAAAIRNNFFFSTYGWQEK